MPIVCKSPSELEKMRRSGHAVREVLDTVKALVRPGVTTMDLERAADQKIRDLGGVPAFKGYQDYPCVLCTSVNHEIVHGIPSEKRVLKEGDIVSRSEGDLQTIGILDGLEHLFCDRVHRAFAVHLAQLTLAAIKIGQGQRLALVGLQPLGDDLFGIVLTRDELPPIYIASAFDTGRLEVDVVDPPAGGTRTATRKSL